MQLARRALLAAPFILAAGKAPLAATPIARLDTRWWRERHQQKLADIRARKFDLVFLGDSITQNWEKSGPPAWQDFQPVWQRLYGTRNALNLGFSGDATSHLLWRIMNGEVEGLSPKAAVILIGANNLGRLRWPPGETIEGIGAVVAETRRRLPRTRILLLGVLPSIRNAWASEATATINAGLASRYGGDAVPMVTYRDVGQVFMRGTNVDPAQFYDPLLTPPEAPLHPTAQAQERMARLIEPTLAALLAG